MRKPQLRSFYCVVCCLLILVVESAFADIRDTKHNLSGVRASAAERGSMTKAEARRRLTQEICVFCHSPNVTDGDGRSGNRLMKPKWAPTTNDSAMTYGTFDDIGQAGTQGDESNEPIGSVSVACLSCHDSTQALGLSIENTEDHPYGIPYRGAAQVMREEAAKRIRSSKTPGFLAAAKEARLIADDSEFRPAQTGVINQRQIWWVSRGESGQRTKSDLPLYPRRDPNGEPGLVPFIECTSCHDPHITRNLFLRVNNEFSNLCLTCHVK